jgi:hypothetical protein
MAADASSLVPPLLPPRSPLALWLLPFVVAIPAMSDDDCTPASPPFRSAPIRPTRVQQNPSVVVVLGRLWSSSLLSKVL